MTARDVEDSSAGVAVAKRFVEGSERDARASARDVIGEDRVFPGRSCTTVDDRKRPRRKRNTYTTSLIDCKALSPAFEKGQYRIRLEGEIENGLSIREGVVAMEVQIGSVSLEISKDESVRGLEGFECGAKGQDVFRAAREINVGEFAKAGLDPSRIFGQALKLAGVDLSFIEIDLRSVVLLQLAALGRDEACLFDFFEKSICLVGRNEVTKDVYSSELRTGR